MLRDFSSQELARIIGVSHREFAAWLKQSALYKSKRRFTAHEIDLVSLSFRVDKAADSLKSEPKPSRLVSWKALKQTDYYTTAELAHDWNLSADTVRRLFEAEAGVMKIGDKNPKHKRRYVTLRIPRAVAERVHRRLTA